MREAGYWVADTCLNAAEGGEGPPILLLHGVTRRWRSWLTVMPALLADWQVWAIDQRGHGRSSRTPGGYRVVDYIPDAVGFLRDVIREPAILIGHSLGGMVAAAVAAAVPELVRALVLEDPTFEMTGSRIGETSFPDVFRAYAPHAGSTRSAAEIARELADAPIRAQGTGEIVRLGDARDPSALWFSASCLKLLDPEVLEPPLAGRWLDGLDTAAVLNGIRCPVLLLQAEFALGGALPDDYARSLVECIDTCLPIKMSKVGHSIHSTAPESMLAVVLPFLAGLDLPCE
jgi:pimeloyl-ACP methyl ester carboxylesterase